MAQTNHERVGRALQLLSAGLRPFVEREVGARAGGESLPPNLDDAHVLLGLVWNRWNELFDTVLGRAERSLVSELRDVRNRWAHQELFSTDDAYRALDTTARLLAAVSAPEAQEVDRQKHELMRQRYEEQARKETRRAAVSPVTGAPTTGLRPWRELVMPHPDVSSGNFEYAQFAADLDQVHRGEGADEYRDPREFFHRTFMTDGLSHLLVRALQRLEGAGGDPIVGLQTNFGGGKTHSMLALFHLFSGARLEELPNVEEVLQAAGVARAATARRAVLVGQAMSPAQPRTKPDGTVTRTFWGELGWQLLGPEGYALVAEADRTGVSPGSEALRELFGRAAPCLILIDEWLQFVRQLYNKHDLPAGSFDANMAFVQALTEAARATPQTLVVASLPASDMEAGGDAGRLALDRLQHLFARMESPWRPASAEEGFEIVRRRLFQPIRDPDLCRARDAVARAFVEMYREQASEFPSSCGEAVYMDRIKAAYPIHPELFDRLYEDWSTLDRFQRTRGVLQLMAAVIHELWERQDGSLLIMPSGVPVDAVHSVLTRYLEEPAPWAPVIDGDVDGPNSLPLTLDRENPNLGRYSACRRVARTLFLGSAPTLHAAHQGLEDRQIKLGCVQPGENVGPFGDALRRLSESATHIYVDGQRYWYSTQPSVARLARDRAAQLSEDTVLEEIRKRLRAEAGKRGEFARVHVCPSGSSDVTDERETRLVILDPEVEHAAREEQSSARQAAQTLLDSRGSGPRLYRNSLVFLTADRARLAELKLAVRQYLAWRSISDERKSLDLTQFQIAQAETKQKDADAAAVARIPEAFHWLLAPSQPDPQGAEEWVEVRMNGSGALAERATRKLKQEDLLLTEFAGVSLRLHLDRVPLWKGDSIRLVELRDLFARYLYLPRLQTPDLLLEAVADGVGLLMWEEDAFAYATGWDASREKYDGLTVGSGARPIFTPESLIVRSEAAAAQAAAEDRSRGMSQETRTTDGGGATPGTPVPTNGSNGHHVGPPLPADPVAPLLRRFHGAVTLPPNRLVRDAGEIADAIVRHLDSLKGASVAVTVEIHAEAPEGMPDTLVRTVSENCRTLKFTHHAFEEE